MSESKFLSLAEAAKAFPKIDGRHPHVASVWRARAKGVVARSGRRIRLESVRVGRRIAIPVGAVERFLAALAAEDMAHFDAAPDREAAREFSRRADDGEAINQTPRRRREIERAKAEAKKLGV